jgi:hypothetical protein
MCVARVVCVVEEALPVTVTFDSGADQSVIPPKTLEMLKEAGKYVKIYKLAKPVAVKGFAGSSHTVEEEAVLTLKFDTEAGKLVLANVRFWVASGDLPAGIGDMLLSRPIMYKLGYDPKTMLRQAAEACGEYDIPRKTKADQSA